MQRVQLAVLRCAAAPAGRMPACLLISFDIVLCCSLLCLLNPMLSSHGSLPCRRRCLHRVASCDEHLAIAGVSSSASDALLPAAHVLLAAVGDMMGSRQPAPVREQATQVCPHLEMQWVWG